MSVFSTLQSNRKYGLYQNISSSTLIKTGPGTVQGIVINSHSSGVIKIWDNTSAATTVMFNSMTLSSVATTGERFIDLFGAKFVTGLYIQIVSGTADITVIYN